MYLIRASAGHAHDGQQEGQRQGRMTTDFIRHEDRLSAGDLTEHRPGDCPRPACRARRRHPQRPAGGGQGRVHQGGVRAGRVTDIVARAGASVGSLYHHFSGKADLYLALFDELENDYIERTRSAVRGARDAGVADPMVLFLIGARGYLDVSIEQRELAGVFARGDGPPGFEMVWQQRLRDWVSKNTEFFARSGEPLDEAVAIVMTGAMMLAVPS